MHVSHALQCDLLLSGQVLHTSQCHIASVFVQRVLQKVKKCALVRLVVSARRTSCCVRASFWEVFDEGVLFHRFVQLDSFERPKAIEGMKWVLGSVVTPSAEAHDFTAEELDEFVDVVLDIWLRNRNDSC